jgi:hypothetical protein
VAVRTAFRALRMRVVAAMFRWRRTSLVPTRFSADL